MNRVLVTGGGGFLGYPLVMDLLARDVAVNVLVGRRDDAVREPPPEIRSVRAEITDFEALSAIAAGCDTVIHLAGPASVGASFEAPAAYAAAHVDGTATVLDVCRHVNITRLVYVSSAEVYGASSTQPVSESQSYDPRSPYAAAKVGAEQMIRAYVNAFGIEALVLRPFSIYGPGQPAYALVPSIVRQALTSDAIVLSDLKPVRDYCFVNDVVDAIVLAGISTPSGHFTFNIGSGSGTSVLALARAALTEVGRDIPILTSAPATRPKKADIFELIADNRLAKSVLGWSPRTTLAQGLQNTIRSWKA